MTLVSNISPTGIKAIRERISADEDRRDLAKQINEAVQEYGAMALGQPRRIIADDEALAIGLALGALQKIIKGWERP